MMRVIWIVAFLCVALPSWADVEVVGDRTWSYNDWLGEVWVAGVSPSTGDIVIPSTLSSRPVMGIDAQAFFRGTLTSVEIPTSVTTIGTQAFRACANLKSVTIPSSVTNIYWWAFYNNSLTSIVVNAENPKYDSRNNCNAIIETATGTLLYGCQETVIPEGVTSIAENAFGCCYGLMSMTIPEGVTNIDESAFQGCRSLTNVTLPSTVVNIGMLAFCGCNELKGIVIPRGVKSIGTSVFARCCSMVSIVVDQDNAKYDSRYGCNAIIDTETGELIRGCQSTVIPSGVTSIGISAFMGCSELTNMNIPMGVTYIGSAAFEECSALKNIAMPTGVTSIDSSAFAECGNLSSVMIPSTVKSIGWHAFDRCVNLSVVYVEKGDVARVRGLYAWPSKVEFVEVIPPTVAGDDGAIVTGDPESGFVVRPSAENTAVEVAIPQGVPAAKVTVQVSASIEEVKPNGASVRIFNRDADITDHLDVPSEGGSGWIDMTQATVKEVVVKEALDLNKGAVVELNASNPVIETAPTKWGLTYYFFEGATLGEISGGTPTAVKIGDGGKWTPPISVKGGESAFYSIGVSK